MKKQVACMSAGLALWSAACGMAGALSVQVQDVPVRSVLEGLARSAQINLIVDDTVEGTLTVHLQDVTAEEALAAIARQQNLFYEKKGAIRTMSAGRRNGKEGMKQAYVWQLQYAAPEDIAEAARALVPDADVRRHDDTNSVVIGGTGQEAAAVQQLIDELDTAPQQVDIEVEVASIDRSALRQAGVEWDWSALSGGSGDHTFSFIAQIRALEEKGSAHILARPHMLSVNGREASILIGDKIPVQTEHLSGGEKTTTTTYEDAGIKLRCIPRIHDDGSVTSHITAEVSTPVFVPELKAYRIATRQAQTVVRMNPGETVAIGGLIRREDVESLRKVPLLGDLPLLGKLFRSKYKSSKETEVVILLRAHTRS